MRKSFLLMLAMVFLIGLQGNAFSEDTPKIKLGSDLLLSKYHHAIDGKNIGLVTNQTGVNGEGKHIVDVLSEYPKASLKAIYTPEYGLDGQAKAGEDVESYIHPTLNIPVYSLYGKTRMPTQEMLQEIDVLIFDIQDIGARTYTYISTLNYCMIAAKQSNKSIIVLDRPNPLSGNIVDGPVMEEPLQTLVGADILPMAHGMTVGELAQYFNRKIGVNLTVIPMEGYSRSMVFQDTGLSPQEIQAKYGEELNQFKEDRKKYLIYGDMQDAPSQPPVEQPQIRKVKLAGGLSIKQKSYVPLKPVLQEFGYQIGWDPVAKQVIAEKPGKKIVIETVKTPMKVWVNGAEVKSKDIIPMIKAGVMYIPAQFIPWIEKSQQKTAGNQVQIHSANLEIVVGITVVKKPEQKPVAKKESGKIAYLTFDDGPSLLTPQILDILKEKEVKATFFVIGRNIKGHEAVLKRAVAEGHAIGGHSYSHNYDVIYHDVDSFFKDIEKGQKAIEQVTGKKTSVFRFPGGSNNTVSKKAQDSKVYSPKKWIMNDLVKEAQERGYHYYDWNVSVGDASSQGYTAESALKRVQEEIKLKKDVVILSHDSSPKINTVKALPKIIEILKKEGYSFKTLDDAVEGFTFLR